MGRPECAVCTLPPSRGKAKDRPRGISSVCTRQAVSAALPGARLLVRLGGGALPQGLQLCGGRGVRNGRQLCVAQVLRGPGQKSLQVALCYGACSRASGSAACCWRTAARAEPVKCSRRTRHACAACCHRLQQCRQISCPQPASVLGGQVHAHRWGSGRQSCSHTLSGSRAAPRPHCLCPAQAGSPACAQDLLSAAQLGGLSQKIWQAEWLAAARTELGTTRTSRYQRAQKPASAGPCARRLADGMHPQAAPSYMEGLGGHLLRVQGRSWARK